MRKYTIIQDSLHELNYLFGTMVGIVNTGQTVSNNVQRKCQGMLWGTVQNMFRIYQKNAWSFPISKVIPVGLLSYVRFTYLPTYSMEQSPSWEANQFSASQEFPRILWNPKVHYRIRKCPPPLPILSQIDPAHALTSHFLKIHLNIILPSKSGSFKWSFPQVSTPKSVYTSAPWCTQAAFNEDS